MKLLNLENCIEMLLIRPGIVIFVIKGKRQLGISVVCFRDRPANAE